MKKYTFEDVSYLDDQLYQLALYEATKGKLIIPRSPEQMLRLQEKVATKFNYYKDIIRSGEADMDFIAYQVLKKYGPYAQDTEEMDEPDYDVITRYISERDAAEAEIKVINQRTNDILDSLMNKFENHLERGKDEYREYPEDYEDYEDCEDCDNQKSDDDLPF